VIARPEWFSGTAVLILAFATLLLVAGVCFFPFLSLRAVGLGNAASLFDAILVFTGGQLALLGWAVAALILAIPAIRMALLIFVLGPVTLGFQPARLAAPAFALSEKLRPWSMIEVFALGGAVSLIKVSGEAKVTFGPAFWMFIALVAVVLVQEWFMCRWSIWNRLTPAPR
jgi:paraquat-inducible protein A